MLSRGPAACVRRLLAASACLAATFALAQAPAQAASRVTISGLVTSPYAGHHGLEGIEVCATRYDKSGKYLTGQCQITAANGRYSMSLPAGTYDFGARDPYRYGAWVDQPYNGGKRYKVSSAKIVNFQMVHGAKITGYLRMPDGSAPGDNALSVYAYKVHSNGKVDSVNETFSNTADAGYFEVSKLPVGRYVLQVVDNGNAPRMARQWFPNAATASTSTPISVSTGQVSRGYDMTLTPGSTLKLAVKSPEGKPHSASTEVFDADGRRIEFGSTIGAGIATIDGLHAGAYRVKGTSSTVAYAQWYSKKKSLATANRLTVGTGATLSRSFTIHYPKLKATKRPRVKIVNNSVEVKRPKWNKKAQIQDVTWYRDGKLTNRSGIEYYLTSKADVGHRIKACYIVSRTGYDTGRSCSKYTKKIKRY